MRLRDLTPSIDYEGEIAWILSGIYMRPDGQKANSSICHIPLPK